MNETVLPLSQLKCLFYLRNNVRTQMSFYFINVTLVPFSKYNPKLVLSSLLPSNYTPLYIYDK